MSSDRRTSGDEFERDHMKLLGFEPGERLYRGRGSVVYRGRRLADGAAVVLKLLRPLHAPPEKIVRFRHEYETLRSLDGEGVVQAYGLETIQKRWVMIQEDFGGISLDRWLPTRDVELVSALDISIAIVKALDKVHSKGVIHKDMNPSNIVYDESNQQFKIIDFGIATVLARETPSARNPNMLEGTLPYISPEQTGRMNKAVDYRTDFYSLGATLYEILTGRPPFSATDPMELIHCHIATRPPRPDQVNSRVPRVLGDVIMKLLEKTAEGRYQSTYGILRDLEQCRDSLHQHGKIVPFEPAREDASARFLLPQKLYGRERNTETLFSAFEDMTGESGLATMTLVTGPSGIGKSALVLELARPVTTKRGYFLYGKFDQFHRGIPYSAVVQAFRGLVRDVLTETEEKLLHWKQELLTALGRNGQVIIDVIPEIEWIIGPQGAVQALEPTEAKNRFNQVLRDFIRVFARPQHPLVLFLDDLQWADGASLKLIELVMTDDRPQSLLLIGSYRDNEVSSTHPLALALAGWRERGVEPKQIELTPLSAHHVAQLIADTVHVDPDGARPLADLVTRNTEGNPLFVTELLKNLHDDGLMTFDRNLGQWQWDVEEIEGKGATENILELMIGKLRRLDETTRRVLCLAACVGSQFHLKTLSVISEQTPRDTFGSLLPAIEKGVIVITSEIDVLSADSDSGDSNLRFFHDRVQQAAYGLLDDEQRSAIHLEIGRLLWADSSESDRVERIFDLVDQLNRGRRLMTDSEERVGLSEMNLLAGHRAKESAAYAGAAEYLKAGVEVLPENEWEHHYDLAFSLHRELAIVEYLNGGHQESEKWSRIALQQARTELEKADLYYIVASQSTMSARYDQTLDAVRRGLALLQIDLPKEAWESAMFEELQEIEAQLEGVDVSSLVQRPTMTNPQMMAAIRLLQAAVAPAMYTDQFLFALVTAKPVNISLQYGNPPVNLDLFSTYGDTLVKRFQRYDEGYAFGTLALELSERAGNAQDVCRSSFFLANWILPWVKHLRDARPINNQGFEAALESGEFMFGGYTLTYKGLNDFYCGRTVSEVLTDVREYLAWCRKVGNTLGADTIEAQALAFANLSGETEDWDEFQSDGMTDVRFVAMLEHNKTNMGLCFYYILKAQIFFIYRDLERAEEFSRRAADLLEFISGYVAIAEHAFYTALLHCALIEQENDSGRRQDLRQVLDGHRDQLAHWESSCPENFSHMRALVEAETARLESRIADAIESYEEAIERAEQNGFQQDVALANELAARFWLERGSNTLSRGYLSEAYYRYSVWGARHKIRRLEGEFPWLKSRFDRQRSFALAGGVSMADTTSEHHASVFDLTSVVKASQAIAGEIVLQRLLKQLMKLVIENAGAQRGVLVLDTDGRLMVQATAAVDTTSGPQSIGVEVLQELPLDDYGEHVSRPVIDYALRTQEDVILNDAMNEGIFTRDPYVLSLRPQSILGLFLSHHGRVLGVLYLENSLLKGAFTEERLEILRLLSSQFAISLENAVLYDAMEQKVEERTQELAAKNDELKKTLTDLTNAQRRLVHSEKMASLGQLTAGVAHEINNPLNFVNNFAEVSLQSIQELLGEGTDSLTDRLRDECTDLQENLELILSHGSRAAGIVTSMLQHARGSSGEAQETDLSAFVDKYLKLAEFSGEGRTPNLDVTIERRFDNGIGPVMLVQQEMGRVLVNLFTNAFDALAERYGAGNEGDAVVSVCTRTVEGQAEILVTDNGPGIPDAIRDRLFEPFFTTKPPNKGTGLGLSLCYDIVVHGHGGRLSVESTPGEGATFVVTLPNAVSSS